MNLKYLFAGLLAGVLLISCGGNKSTNTEGNDNDSPSLSETVSGLKGLNKLADAASDIDKVQQELTEKTPLSNDEIKALLPETLAGMKRSSFSVGDPLTVGMNMGEASYSDENKEMIKLSIMDGAGETGSAIVSLALMGLSMEKEEQTESGFSKTTTIEGFRASVKEEKGDGWMESEITAVVSNRYLVTLSSRYMKLEELEKAFKALDLKNMK